MNAPDPRDWIALHALASDYWFEVDRYEGKGIASFWIEDGLFCLEDTVFEGRAAIERFYDWRAGRGSRVSLHVVTNVRIRMAPDCAEVCSVVTLYGADGVAPIKGASPITVAVADDKCVRGAEGQWRYASRRIRQLFVGHGEVTLPKGEKV